MLRLRLAIAVLCVLAPALAPEVAAAQGARVEDLFPYQQGDNVILEYALRGAPQGEVRFQVSLDGGATWSTPKAARGDLGPGVARGPGRRIVWPVLEDYPDGLDTLVKLEVYAVGEQAAKPPVREHTLTIRPNPYGDSVSVDGEPRAPPAWTCACRPASTWCGWRSPATSRWRRPWTCRRTAPSAPTWSSSSPHGSRGAARAFARIEGGCFQMGSPEGEEGTMRSNSPAARAASME
jgi:hypothetical protein